MIMDLLHGGVAAASLPFYGFTADNTVKSVAIAPAAPAGSKVFFNGVGAGAASVSSFAPKDNLVIRRAMLAAPYGYRAGGDKMPNVQVTIIQGAAAPIPIVELGSGTSGIRFPDFNVWVDVNIAVFPWITYFAAAVKVQLGYDSIIGEASQAGMAAVLNAAVIRVTPILQVEHTLDMIA